jgi:hypothetical protein
MNYEVFLSENGASARQVLAAHFIRHRSCVIEIGSGNNPISRYLTHSPQVVYLIDPKLADTPDDGTPSGVPPNVVRIFRKYQTRKIAPSQPFALVLLGLSLKGFGSKTDIDDEFCALLSNAGTVVIDFAINHARATDQYQRIRRLRGSDPIVDIDLRINDEAITMAGFSERKFVVFEG